MKPLKQLINEVEAAHENLRSATYTANSGRPTHAKQARLVKAHDKWHAAIAALREYEGK